MQFTQVDAMVTLLCARNSSLPSIQSACYCEHALWVMTDAMLVI